MNKFKWVWLEERNFGALVNTTWSKAKKIFSFLQVFFLLLWRKTPSLIPTLHFISMPFLKKKCHLRIEEKKVWTNETHLFCSNAYIENSGLKKEFDIKPVSLVGFVKNLELKTFFWLRKFTLKVDYLATSLHHFKKSVWLCRKRFEVFPSYLLKRDCFLKYWYNHR